MNTNLMGICELSSSLGARLISFSDAENSDFSSVSIDSRIVKEGALFFALKGQYSDGHSFVEAAFKSGASAVVVETAKLETFDLENIAEKNKKDLIVVEDTMKALRDSAKAYLEKFPNLIKIGITGSTGKTTTKEITSAIISCEKNVVKNEGNLNSETGFPLSVFNVRASHEVGIFELGMNKANEILNNAEVLKPNIALITTIGLAHIEFFGSKEEIVKQKKSIFNFLTDKDTALIPKDDECAGVLAHGVTGNVKLYCADMFDEFEGTRDLGLLGTDIYWSGEKIHLALPGIHSFEDAMAAVAIAKELSISNSAIKKGIESVKPLFGRFEILKGRTTVIRDCYNANPQSMEKSIELCDSLDWDGRKIYVIGDMLELGKSSFSEHKKLGELLLCSQADAIFLFGTEVTAAGLYMTIKGKFFYHYKWDDFDGLSAALDSYVQTGDLVLLKGSRRCALERLTEMLIGEALDVS